MNPPPPPTKLQLHLCTFQETQAASDSKQSGEEEACATRATPMFTVSLSAFHPRRFHSTGGISARSSADATGLCAEGSLTGCRDRLDIVGVRHEARLE